MLRGGRNHKCGKFVSKCTPSIRKRHKMSQNVTKHDVPYHDLEHFLQQSSTDTTLTLPYYPDREEITLIARYGQSNNVRTGWDHTGSFCLVQLLIRDVLFDILSVIYLFAKRVFINTRDSMYHLIINDHKRLHSCLSPLNLYIMIILFCEFQGIATIRNLCVSP